jgi:hypothetical protein
MHVLASRALVRARLRQWDEAIADAEEVPVAQFSHTDADSNPHQVHHDSAIRHWLHRKECIAGWPEDKARSISSV